MKHTKMKLARSLVLAMVTALGACAPSQGGADSGPDADLFDVILRPDVVAAGEASAEAAAGDAVGADATADGAVEGGAGDGGSCRGADNCYSCPPTESVHFLDRCTDGRCTRFDNVARLPLFNNGMLPPLR